MISKHYTTTNDTQSLRVKANSPPGDKCLPPYGKTSMVKVPSSTMCTRNHVATGCTGPRV